MKPPEPYKSRIRAAHLARIQRGELRYQQRAMDEAVNAYMRVIGELAAEARSGLLDDLRLTGNAYIGVDHGTAEPTTTLVYVAEGGRVRVVPEGWPWTPEDSEDVRRNMRQTLALFRGANERLQDLLPEGLLEEAAAHTSAFRRIPPRVEQSWEVPPAPRVREARRPVRQPPPSRREWWR